MGLSSQRCVQPEMAADASTRRCLSSCSPSTRRSFGKDAVANLAFNPTDEWALQFQKQPAPSTGYMYAVAIDEYTASVEAKFGRRSASPILASRRLTVH
ncbi:hypothetical protein H310_02018 [Aphanomyces invadans]|uniref:Uncharacterized protein n=1 Tax=Aphanomyces invadans TaxID=157072 RepID=A0A024UNU9_9STRA|nr:hypothetical protein H310_02018 [Aphanomyces invadans]ETW07517.1 hypothetical protein H310_02018 [Aphanomyces invadans]|eukprot:XP_008863610.1 hypothetical protein H310_02018 [Aphanomyces invadans]